MPNPTPFASNPTGVSVRPLDFEATYAPTAKMYHGTSIVVENNIIGRVQSWQPAAYTREGAHVYELNNTTFGRPVDYVPGRSTGYTVAMTRLEVWGQELELALFNNAVSVFDDLSDQTRPFTSLEYLYRGQSIYRIWQYLACWLQDRNEDAFSAEGDGRIMATANFAYVRRFRSL